MFLLKQYNRERLTKYINDGIECFDVIFQVKEKQFDLYGKINHKDLR
jgi:hypothetical protein